MRSTWAGILVLLLSPTGGNAGENLPPVSLRFKTSAAKEIPDFQRHVVPLLGRLGCNGRACHGSFQGQGGFRLSLFGYDFEADHAALTKGDTPRVDLKEPAKSLILQKPTLTIDHDGGERFVTGEWEYHLLKRWIEAGALGQTQDPAVLEALEIEPKEIVFSSLGETAPLQVTARWSDGAWEDVTPLCRFQTNDESIAAVDPKGIVKSLGKGDTHIVAFYDNGIVPVPVILPVSDRTGKNYPEVPTPTEIDRLVVEKLKKVGIVPAELCTDAEFLRRASLDITGTLPTAEEVKEFLEDSSPEKRSRKIEELVSRPSYAAWITSRLCDWTGNSEENLPVGGEQGVRRDKSLQWYDWMYRRVAENVPYDEIVEGLVMATSRHPEQSDTDYFTEMTAYFREKNPADFSERETMPYFWSRGRFSPPQTLRFSYAFLGVRLECAECHKHPYDQWTQADYQDFQSFFSEIRFRYTGDRGGMKALKEKLGLTADQDSGGYKRLFASLAHEGTMVPWGEVVAPDWQKRKKPKPDRKNPPGRVITPRLLGGEAVLAEQYHDPREPVMDWLKEQENPYFARAIVNRIWAGYFGVGIINPPDDMNLANPATNEPLLDYLAKEFIAHGYDLKWLHREITNSRTYQLSYQPNPTNEQDERNYSRALVRRLPAEVTYDNLVFATATSQSQQAMQLDNSSVRNRQIGFPEERISRDAKYALTLFGKPPRAQACDCERSNEPSLLQTVYLRNDAQTLALLDRKDGWLAEWKKQKPEAIKQQRDELIQEAWLRTFSRMPNEEERAIGREHLASAKDEISGLRDLLWALLNSKEFILNH